MVAEMYDQTENQTVAEKKKKKKAPRREYVPTKKQKIIQAYSSMNAEPNHYFNSQV